MNIYIYKYIQFINIVQFIYIEFIYIQIYLHYIALSLSIYKQNTVTAAFMRTKRKVHHLE